MDGSKKAEALTFGDYMARYADPLIIRTFIDPAFTAWAKGGEFKPLPRTEKVKFSLRNKCYEWRGRLALWIAPWLEGAEELR
ncbi:hypothetical protein [Asaia sp. HumB]|uniref:hypothetical protein n=1 Tax=Asaia sp. HumB TaxID=3035475 RepID=UPI0025529317|nr:hypothetical protein [Asaia sp. HumB]MDL2172448.1 hypothetical protein [Asaia sp. HumB]